MQFEKPTKKQIPLPSEGLHDAQITAVVDLGVADSPWGKKPQLYVDFDILDEKAADGSELRVRKYFNNSLNPKSTFYGCVNAALGQVPDSFNDEHLLNRKVRIITSNSEPDNDGRIWARIDKIMPPARKGAQ